MLLNRYFFFVLFFVFPTILVAQIDTTNELYANEIFCKWTHLENKFKEAVYKKLLLSLEEDPILKMNFLEGDSSNFKKLKLIISPILKFKKEAIGYDINQNIFELIEFDTINYQSVVQIYLEDTVCFFITRGHHECDIGPLRPGGTPLKWCPGDFIFKQKFYLSNKVNDCLGPTFRWKKDTSFIFFIDFFMEAFLISNNRISIYPESFYTENLDLLGKPNEFIIKVYGRGYLIDRISDCTKKYPSMEKKKKPWWQFW